MDSMGSPGQITEVGRPDQPCKLVKEAHVEAKVIEQMALNGTTPTRPFDLSQTNIICTTPSGATTSTSFMT